MVTKNGHQTWVVADRIVQMHGTTAGNHEYVPYPGSNQPLGNKIGDSKQLRHAQNTLWSLKYLIQSGT